MGVNQRVARAGVALFIALSVVAQARAQTTANPAGVRIGNFGQINEIYYRGQQPVGRDYADLAKLGVKMIIDLTRGGSAEEQGIVEGLGMKFRRIPMTTSDRPSDAAIAEFLKLVNDPANQPVYVHCQGGRHRTGVMTAAYRITHDGWTADQAYGEMKKFKFEGFPGHPELKQFVYDFYAHTAAAAASRASASVNRGSVR